MIRKKSIYFVVFIMVVLLLIFKVSNNAPEHFVGEVKRNFLDTSKENIKNEDSLNVTLYSPNAILIDLNNNIFMEKRSEEKISPASLTKIMSAIVAIEHLRDLNKEITLQEEMFAELYEANASMAGFLPNEKLAAIDLLYGMMLPSGAEASIGLATNIAGTEEAFVKLMNEKANQLGMENTNFINVTGLHHPEHYSNVKDISKLLQYALKNDVFREIFTAERYSISPTNRHPDGITFTSTLFRKIETNAFVGGEILGGKTGYTEQAGLCLASLAYINGQEYILVTAGADGDQHTEQYNITDAFAVYQHLGSLM